MILENVPSPNAMEFGPDGLLYFPVMDANEIWRIDPDGGEPERVAGDLGVPDSVKFDADGHIVSTQVFSGQVLRDQSAQRRADRAGAADPRIWTTAPSPTAGCSSRTSPARSPRSWRDGSTRAALPGGLNWPLDLAVGDDGLLVHRGRDVLLQPGPSGTQQIAGMLFTPGYPGFLRGLTPAGPG